MGAIVDLAVALPGFLFEPDAPVLYASDTRDVADGAANWRRGKMPDVDFHADTGMPAGNWGRIANVSAIPFRGEVGWHLDGNWHPVWTGELTDWRFE
ncbi:hypothetical protein [Bradyrhizobium sp. 5.13L]|jgi:hypothetical protein